jgi:CHAD domain-containing protein
MILKCIGRTEASAGRSVRLTEAFSLDRVDRMPAPADYSSKRGDSDANVDPKTPASDFSRFTVPVRLRIKDLMRSLGQALVVESDRPIPVERTFLDTFDWRLHAASMALELRVSGQSGHLIWQPLSCGDAYAVLPVAVEPRFGADLPDGPMREAIAPILGPRALLPQARLSCRQHLIRVLTPNGELAVTLEIREERPRRRGEARGWTTLRFLPQPGGEALAQAIQDRLAADFGLESLVAESLAAVLEAAGIRPDARDSKAALSLEPDMPAEVATRAVLGNLLATIKANVPGVCANLDSEFLHDFRVAIRRTRAALSQLRHSLSSRTVGRYREEFTWLGQLSSPARDLDVYLLAFDDFREALPANLREPFASLHPLLREARDREYHVLREGLRSERFRKLIRHFGRFLRRKPSTRRKGRDAGRPVASVARERICDLYLAALAEGAAIDLQSHPDQLHELRKTCKKLRYLMEFFAPIFPGEEILALISVLKAFQDNLGEVQDLRVQQAFLADFARQIEERRDAHPGTLEAIAWLSAHQGKRQQAACAEFAIRFASFAAEDNRRRFRALFAPEPSSGSQQGVRA